MKNISKIILGTAALLAAFSCSKLNEPPVFEESESFAAFEKSSYSVNENVGKISIPVTIASIQPVKTAVSYRIVDGTAKSGVNVKDTNPSAVLSYDGTSRTQNIELEIVNLEGEYTGDLRFTVELESATGLKLSAEKVCTVTIADLDHPLSSILGSYAATSTNFSGTDIAWTLTMTKDETDVTVVHIDFLTQGSQQYSSWGDWSYVGTVSSDLKTISIPCGQACEAWYQSEDDVFILYSWEPGASANTLVPSDAGNITFTQVADGQWVSDKKVWLYPAVTQAWYGNFCTQEITLKKL